MADQQKAALLVIADISGYTRFMLQNAEVLRHAQAVITALMATILKEAKIPLQVAKLEGDAVFLYATDRGTGWTSDLTLLRDRLGGIFVRFDERARALQLSNTCPCDACSQIDRLTLKIIVHYGPTLFYRLGKFDELAGPDVIILHRLLKNGVDAKAYWLVSEAAYQVLGLDVADPLFVPHVERYDDVGDIPVRVRTDLSGLQFAPDSVFLARHRGIWQRLLAMVQKMWGAVVTARGRTFGHLEQ